MIESVFGGRWVSVATGAIIGSVIDGRYTVLSLLGEGGSGAVYKAEQTELNRIVAIKLLHAGNLPDQQNQTRFLQEARILSRLEHQNIVKIYSYGIWDNQYPYMAMEYLEGQSLLALLKEKAMSESDTLEMAIQICQGLALAHQSKVIHRDLKPQNIMMLNRPGPDRVKILDFGLSKLLSDSEGPEQKLTRTGTLLGTVHYMSPEACAGQPLDQRADIYSVGCILYECCAGSPPFEADSAIGILYKHRSELPRPISELPLEVPISKELEKVIFKCIQKDPNDRYSSAEELIADLTLIKEGRGHELEISDLRFKNRASGNRLFRVAIFSSLLLLGFASMAFYVFKAKSQFETRTLLAKKSSSAMNQEKRSAKIGSVRIRLARIGDDLDKLSGTPEVPRRSLLELDRIIDSKETKERPLLFMIYQLRGRCLVYLGEQDKAMESYRIALKHAKTSSGEDTNVSLHPLCGIALVYANKHNSEQAESAGKKVIELWKASADGKLAILDLPSWTGIAIGGNSTEVAYGMLADLACQRKDWHQASFYCNSCLDTHAERLDPDMSLRLAEISLKQGKTEEALDAVKALTETVIARAKGDSTGDVGDVYSYYAIALWNYKHKYWQQAASCFRACVQQAKRTNVSDYSGVAGSIHYLSELKKQGVEPGLFSTTQHVRAACSHKGTR